MKRTIGFAFFFAAAVALTGCPDATPTSGGATGGGATASAPAKPDAPKGDAPKADAPKAAPKADDGMTTMPGFEDVKKGQKYVYKMQGGMLQENEIVDKNDDEVQIKTTNIMNGTAMAGAATNTIKLKMKKTGDAPPANAPKAVGHETVKAAGKDWDCDIYEMTTEAAGQKFVTKSWTSKKYPFTIKSEMNGAVSMELSEIK